MARAKIVSDHVTVRVLGATEITVGTRRIGMSTEALFALALYLTTRAGERVPREDVLETFWPGGEEESRRHAMRQMLYRLRQKGFAFDEDGDTLRLDPAKVESDLRTCLEPSWPESATPAGVDAALSLGPTFSTRLPRPFLEWFDGVRTDVSHQARKAAMQLIATSRSQGRWADLDRWAKAVLAIDPLNEEATLARAEAAAMSGAKNLALEILDGYLAEIGDVDSSVGKPAQQLRKRIAERRASWIPTGPREVALIGREEEMSALTQAVEAALQGKSRSVLLVGPSGYGKSRLLAEAREYAALRGVRCVVVRAEATLASHPWSLVREICRALISQPGAAGIPPRAMETVRTLLREDPSADSGIGFGPVTTPEAMRQALIALVEAVSHEARTLLTLDDLQNSDDKSLWLVHEMLVDTQGGRCTCLAATHPAAQPPRDRPSGRLGAQVLRLAQLSTDAARSLAEATAKAHNVLLSDPALDHIASSSGGHPLFARELALSYSRSGSPKTLPATLADVVRRNLSSQSADSTRVLRIVALMAGAATVGRVQRASGLAASAFLEAIDLLSLEGVLHLDQARMLRLHDSWRDGVLTTAPEAVIATLALECAAVLQDERECRSPDVQSQLAALYRLGGERDLAMQVGLEFIDSLLAAGLYESALDSIECDPPESISDVTKARLSVRQSVALLATGQPAPALLIADEVWRSRILQTTALVAEHLLAVGVSIECHLRLDRANRAPAAELLALATHSRLSPQDASRACLWGVRYMVNAANNDGLSRFAAISRSIASAAEVTPTQALTNLILAAETGTTADIAEAYDVLRRLDQDQMALRDRCLLLRCAAHALRIAGQPVEAVATAESACRLAQSNGLTDAARMAGELLVHTNLDYCDVGEAAKWLAWLNESASESTVASTLSASAHMRDRLAYCSGNLEGLPDRILSRLETTRALGHAQSRGSELALAAVVLSSAHLHVEASSVLESAIESAMPFSGRYSADVMFDACLAAAVQLDNLDAVKPHATTHVVERTQVRGLEIPPAFKHLRTLRASLP